MDYDWIDWLLLLLSLGFSGWGGCLLVLIPPGWQEDRRNEWVGRSYFTSRYLGEDRSGQFGGCMSSWAGDHAAWLSSWRAGTWMPLFVLAIGLTIWMWKTPGIPGWFTLDENIPDWLHAISCGRFWLAVVAACIGLGYGAWLKSKSGQ